MYFYIVLLFLGSAYWVSDKRHATQRYVALLWALPTSETFWLVDQSGNHLIKVAMDLMDELLTVRGEPALVTDELQDFRKIADHFRGIYRIYPSLMKENQRMLTCNRLDLQTFGSQLIMPKNLPNLWKCSLCRLICATRYRNTIAGSPPGEWIFIYFRKIRLAFSKLNFSIYFFSKKTQ